MSIQESKSPDQIDVHHLDMGGWVRFFTNPESLALPNLPLYLAYAVTTWFRERPQLRLLCVLPVNKDGNTVELHVWYTQHSFPPPPVSSPR
ncbi:MAG TPA: hypothetical protein VH682_24275 [Gemmataceae bacterium]